MAANILQLYKKGYRNFVFISTLNNILEKTKENFLNNSEDNQKYLFSDLNYSLDDFYEGFELNKMQVVGTTFNGLGYSFQVITEFYDWQTNSLS